MKKLMIPAAAAAILMLFAGSCKGRTQENMTPDSDTIEISGGVVDMPTNPNDSQVIADSPAEAAAQATQQADSTNTATPNNQ